MGHIFAGITYRLYYLFQKKDRKSAGQGGK